MFTRRRIVGAALVLAAAWSYPLQSAVLQLAPIPIEVEAPQAAAVLSLGNRASAEVALQIRVFRWSQVNGEDKLDPTQDLAVSPPIAVVPAGQTLTVRVVRLAKEAPTAEETYRIWVDELPAGKAKPSGNQLRILMRYSVPAFFEPPAPASAPAALSWRLSHSKKGWLLSASNPGARRVRISGLQLRSPDGTLKALPAGGELSGYVLAGQQMLWPLKLSKDFPALEGGRYGLSYETEGESKSESLRLGPAH